VYPLHGTVQDFDWPCAPGRRPAASARLRPRPARLL